MDVALDARVGPGSGSADAGESFNAWDGIVGTRGQVKFGDHWHVLAYGDFGAGESDHTYQGITAVGYRFQRAHLLPGYRYYKWDLGKGQNPLMTDLDVKGPSLGYKFIWGG